jgi:hypothetical protein
VLAQVGAQEPPRAAPPDSWRSLRSARVPPCTTWTSCIARALEQSGGSGFNRRNLPKWVRIQPALTGATALFPLDGTGTPIHGANKAAGLRLDEGNVLDYLKFFTDNMVGEEGPFVIVEEPVAASSGQVFPAWPPRIEDCDGGGFICTACVLYDGAVFKSRFLVCLDGRVEMLDDDPIEPVAVN